MKIYDFFCRSVTIFNRHILQIINCREKWSLFDESTHVPLIIHHPLSPFKGQRYSNPVELLDIFPTINDLLAAPYNKRQIYGSVIKPGESGFTRMSIPLQGKSLAPLILGKQFKYRAGRTNNKIIYNGNSMPTLNQSFALSQTWRCASNKTANLDPRTDSTINKRIMQWDICDAQIVNMTDEVSVMGYSMRTLDFRYTQYIPFHRLGRFPLFDEPIYTEELYDHRDDVLGDLGRRELVNLASDNEFSSILLSYRTTLRDFIWNEIVFLNMSTTFKKLNLPLKKTKRTSKQKLDRKLHKDV